MFERNRLAKEITKCASTEVNKTEFTREAMPSNSKPNGSESTAIGQCNKIRSDPHQSAPISSYMDQTNSRPASARVTSASD